MTTEDNPQLTLSEDAQRSLNKRLEAISWGLFLIMIGASMILKPLLERKP